jgi:hypothetical protein
VTREALEDRLLTQVDDTQRTWLTEALKRAASGTTTDLLRAYTEASRFLARASLAPGGPDADADSLAQWTAEDAGRLLLLLTRHAHIRDPETFANEAIACYEQGDAREQQSWMHGVAHLPDAERYLPLVIDTCRTNILPLFQAVACDNPYPARFFPELNFNQMVLKALFNGVPLARIHGLATRANAELARMATDYAAERRAAGRTIPADIGLAMTAGARRTDR